MLEKSMKIFFPLLLAVACISMPCNAADSHSADSLGRGISVRTNLLWGAASEPNLGVEVPVGEHVSVGVAGGLKSWPRWMPWDWDNKENTTHWRNFAVVPEVRYYLDQIYDGWFAGADFIYTHYNVGDVRFPFGLYPEAANFRLQGSYWAGGVFAGYAWWPWEHWRLEADAGLFVGLAAYDRFDCPHCGSKLAEERKVGVVPQVGLNLAYNPVGRTEAERRRAQAQYVLSGTDTITVLTPPVAFTVYLKEIKSPETAGDRLSHGEPWVIPIQNYRPLDYLTRPGKDSILCVKFPLDSWELKRDWAANAEVLDRLQAAVEQIRDEARTSELLVSIVGLASIEGPQERNDTLSIRRARAVADYLSSRTGLGRRQFETLGKGEAWDWFKDQLNAIRGGGEGLSAEQADYLLDIVSQEPDPDVRERRIKANAGLYALVKERLLADQRSSGYIRVYYNAAEDPVTQAYNTQVLPLLKAGRYHDAVRVFQANKELEARAQSDPEATNAYGIALYFTALDKKDEAQEQKAMELVRQAARQGSEAAGRNLEGMAVYGPARKEYDAWLELMKEK